MNAIHRYRARPDLLRGRTILITGAGSGIGRAAAIACARHGATVVLLGRNVAALEAVYDEIERIGAPQPAILPTDLSKGGIEQFEQLAATLKGEFSRLDGLLHNAAELGTLTPLHLYDLATWTQVMQVNLYAPYLLTRACLPLLQAAVDASVIFTSADVGRRGRAYWGAYGVSQFAREGLAQIWADELATNTSVRVNTLDPGAVATRMRTRAYPGEDAAGLAQPDAIMPAYLYLLGPDSRGVTGQTFSAQAQSL